MPRPGSGVGQPGLQKDCLAIQIAYLQSPPHGYSFPTDAAAVAASYQVLQEISSVKPRSHCTRLTKLNCTDLIDREVHAITVGYH